MRKTKIVVTLGPVTANEKMVEKLILRGVNVFRLNFSHGDYEVHKRSIKLIRDACKKLNKDVAILQDISGPKVRIDEIDGVLKLKKSDTLILAKESSSDPHTLALSYPDIIDMVKVGEEVFFADGTLQTVVIEKDDETLTLKLLNDGELTSRKGVNFPKTKLRAPLTIGDTHNISSFCLG